MGIFRHLFLTEGNIPPSRGKRGSDAAGLTSTPFLIYFVSFCSALCSFLDSNQLQEGVSQPQMPAGLRWEACSQEERGQQGRGMGKTSSSDGRLLEAGHF